MESWFLNVKKSNSTKMVLINFFRPQPPHCHTIVRAKIRRKTAFFSKFHKNAVIRVFWHVEFISALKTELNSTVFEKNAINKIKYLIIVIFYFCDFLKKLLAELHKNNGIMVFRWKDAKFGQNGIEQFFSP